METFGDEFFKNIAVPMKKDYSLLSSSPSTFESSTENSEFFQTKCREEDVRCDSPVKVQLSKVLKPKNEMDLIGDLEKLTMFVPAKPEARLSQKRRASQQKLAEKPKENVVKSTPSKIPTASSSSIRKSAGVITRAMAKNNENVKPEIQRSVMRSIPTNKAPLRVNNSTTQNEVRRSVVKATAPIVPPRIVSTPTVSRPVANKPTRTSILRENAAKSRPVSATKGPMRISASRGLFQQTVPATPKAKPASEETKIELPKRPMTSSYANSLFSRLATPKTIRKPTEIKPSEVRRSVCRPIPDYIRSTQKNGLPSIGGLVGIRAPSRSRQPSGSEQ